MVLSSAGLAPGMRVLDIGCGAGDVSLIAARIVGRHGAVVGLDTSHEAIELARSRSAQAGYSCLRFETADLAALNYGAGFDAVVGRFILLHLPNPVAVLRRIGGHLRPGAIAAFLEFDIERAEAMPAMPLLTRTLFWITETYRREGIEPNMGSRLYATFRQVGMTPNMAGSCRVECPPGTAVFGFAAETVRSLLPRILALGVATAEEVDIDTLATRLSREAVIGDHCIFLPRLVGAWSQYDA